MIGIIQNIFSIGVNLCGKFILSVIERFHTIEITIGLYLRLEKTRQCKKRHCLVLPTKLPT